MSEGISASSSQDYTQRSYLSACEASRFLHISVSELHRLACSGAVHATRSASGQLRFDLSDLRRYRSNEKRIEPVEALHELHVNGTVQRIFVRSSAAMDELQDGSINLAVTSPPYFDAKMYSGVPIEGDLGNVHDLSAWLSGIARVWKELFRVMQPGRKVFVNIMNLPIRQNGSFRTLNLVGKTIDLLEDIGFVFKRDIVWQKTNSVRAHFGTYPYPGGILINNAHEFILEFEKPGDGKRYGHITHEQREKSKLEKSFWIEIKKSDVWVMKPQPGGDARSHVAPFPYELPYRLIKAFSYVGETVLDPFLGCGTTLMAAADLGRNGIGFEINPEIARIAVASLNNR
jgi:DNA modification methylase